MGANKFNSHIDQTPITRDFCTQNLYQCRLGAKYESLSMGITNLKEIYHSVYIFLCAIDHLNYHLGVNNTKCTDIQNISSINQVETLCNKHDTCSQPYMPKRQYSELTPSEDRVLDQLLSALKQINFKLHMKLSKHKFFTLFSWVLG